MLLWSFANDCPMCDCTFNRRGYDKQSNTMPITRPNWHAGRYPNGCVNTIRTLLYTLALERTDHTRPLSSAAVQSFYPFSRLLSMLGNGIHRYHQQSPQHTCTAAELGDRRKEDEREGERKRSRGWSSVESQESQGPRSRCQMLTEGANCLPRKSRLSISCSFRACSGQESLG